MSLFIRASYVQLTHPPPPPPQSFARTPIIEMAYKNLAPSPHCHTDSNARVCIYLTVWREFSLLTFPSKQGQDYDNRWMLVPSPISYWVPRYHVTIFDKPEL